MCRNDCAARHQCQIKNQTDEIKITSGKKREKSCKNRPCVLKFESCLVDYEVAVL